MSVKSSVVPSIMPFLECMKQTVAFLKMVSITRLPYKLKGQNSLRVFKHVEA